MGHLFLSYSRRDCDKVRLIRRHLERRGVATFFDEANLRVGRPWPHALEQALSDSIGVAVFVGSAIGNWQWAEVGFALDRQLGDKEFPVIPILLDGADTTRSFLFLNSWLDMRGERFESDEVVDNLVNAVRQPQLRNAPHLVFELNPYRGLEHFDEANAPFYFGRERLIDDLSHRLINDRKNFVAVIGSSGSGKSSVVCSGLVPRLRRQRPPNHTWDVVMLVPGDRPWFRLADAIAPLRFPDKFDADLDVEVAKLYRALESGELELNLLLDRILGRQGRFHRLLLVVDQFEELFTLAPVEQRQRFVDALVEALRVRGVVVMPSLRADFYGQAIEVSRGFSELLGAEQVVVGRLSSDELRRTITEPAKRAGLEFDPGLADLLLRDAGSEPGNLPLLQHALLELYTRRQGNKLTVAAYEEIGGIRRAIATSAELEYSRLSEDEKDVARSLFTQLVRLARVDEGQEDTRLRVPIRSLPERAIPIIEEFASARLRLLVKAGGRMEERGPIIPDSSLARETVEVAHEALIREWSRLKDWLNEDREFYLWRQRLDQFLNEYSRHGGGADYLLLGPALREAEDRINSKIPQPLSAEQDDYVRKSITQRELESANRADLEREAREMRAAHQSQALEYAELRRAQAESDRTRALAQAFVDRRRSVFAIVAGLISVSGLLIATFWGRFF